MRVIVVGGGIAGLTAAIALGRVGIDAQVYEQAPALREVGAGISLFPNALRVLDVLGLGAAIRAQSVQGVQGALLTAGGKVLVGVPADTFREQIGNIAVLHRADLLGLLAREITGERLHLGHQLVGFEQNGGRVTACFHNGQEAHADALIGADGVRSAVRTRMFGERRVHYAGYTAWRAIVAFDGAKRITETWGRGCRFGIVPMGRGKVYWFATNNAAEGERDPEGRAKEALLRLFRGWHAPVEALIEAAQEGSILRNDIYDMDPLPNCVRENAALVGDAAHAMTPNLGQGACQAIEDAAVLTACLKKHAIVAEALREYERRRQPRTRELVLRSRWFGRIAQVENVALRWAREALLRAAPAGAAARQMRGAVAFDPIDPEERVLFAQ